MGIVKSASLQVQKEVYFCKYQYRVSCTSIVQSYLCYVIDSQKISVQIFHEMFNEYLFAEMVCVSSIAHK